MTLQQFLDRIPWAEMRERGGFIEDTNGNCPILAVACRGQHGKQNARAQSIAIKVLGLTSRDANSIIAAADNDCLGVRQVELRGQMLSLIKRASV